MRKRPRILPLTAKCHLRVMRVHECGPQGLVAHEALRERSVGASERRSVGASELIGAAGFFRKVELAMGTGVAAASVGRTVLSGSDAGSSASGQSFVRHGRRASSPVRADRPPACPNSRGRLFAWTAATAVFRLNGEFLYSLLNTLLNPSPYEHPILIFQSTTIACGHRCALPSRDCEFRSGQLSDEASGAGHHRCGC